VNILAVSNQPLIDFPLKRRRLLFELNVHAPMDLIQAVLPAMVDRGRGWIVNVSSATARLWEAPFKLGLLGSTTGVYGASKAALNRLTNALAAEMADTGVRVNTIESRAAVMSEGAAVLVGASLDADRVESMEAMVEAVVALCDCPPERTGRVHVSLDLLEDLGLSTRQLDGTPYPV
jgi:citronellol/citronellal dehydrogenase